VADKQTVKAKRCGTCARWSIKYALCDYSLQPSERAGQCEAGWGIRYASDQDCSDYKERSDG